jgi:hypothetical protein
LGVVAGIIGEGSTGRDCTLRSELGVSLWWNRTVHTWISHDVLDARVCKWIIAETSIHIDYAELQSACPIKMLQQSAYSNDGPTVYAIAADETPKELGYVSGIRISRVSLRPHWVTGRFDTFTFLVPGNCKVSFSGYTARYKLGTTEYQEFLMQRNIFVPE